MEWNLERILYYPCPATAHYFIIGLNTCRQALESLKEVNPQQATKLSSDFTALINAASQYNTVRNKVAEPTKKGIDSMYQFKSIKLCADIEKELIDSLVKRGDNIKPWADWLRFPLIA